MFGWALTFFLAAALAAVFGFSGMATEAESVARVLFFVFLIAYLVSFIMGMADLRSPDSESRREER